MADKQYPSIAALQKLEASLHADLRGKGADQSRAATGCPHDAHGQSQHAYDPQHDDPHRYDPQTYDQQAYGYDQQAYDQQAYDPHGHEAWAHDDEPDHERASRLQCLAQRRWRLPRLPFGRRVRRIALACGLVGGVALCSMAALWWRLSSGPIELDIATPWLSAAIKENFGSDHEVEIGGTQLERDAGGRTSLRIRDIVVRDPDGTIVASAPKAEVGLSGTGLLTGRVRAERLALVGAEMAVRIESDSQLTVFAGNKQRPFVTASAVHTPVITGTTLSALRAERAKPITIASAAAPAAGRAGGAGVPDLAALLAWIETLDASGLDGRDLTEIGLKSGSLSVDDQRSGKQWTFTNIDLSVTRPKGGGIALTVGSQAAERPWMVRATMAPSQNGRRILDVEAHRVPAKDLMLAMRLGEGQYEPDMPLSGRIRADIGPDGMPKMVDGRLVADKGVVIDLDDPLANIPVDRAEISFDWDAVRQALVMPFQVVSGGNRFTLLAQVEPPSESGGTWGLKVSGGTVVLASTSAADAPLVLNRILLRMAIDPGKQRIDIEQGDIGNVDLGVAVRGHIDYSDGDPRFAIGLVGTRMSVAAMKRMWPIFAATKVRAWVDQHVQKGTVERSEIVINAALSTLKSSGPPVPDDGLSIEIVGHDAEIQPVEGLPAIRDADVNVRISGRTAVINVGRGNVEISPGRKLSITNGVFEVPDTFPKAPPAKARFRLDGSVPAAAELLGMERLRDYSGTPLDAATSRGTLTAQVTLGLPLKADLQPGSSTYTINMDVANFAAERVVMGQKVEAAKLAVTANNHGYWIRGDVKINGVPAALDYRKPRETADAEVRVQATLDENARSKFGLDLVGYLSGPVPVKLSGRVPANGGDSRLAVDADLTQAKIDNLLPGWSKPSGKAARATFTLVKQPSMTRFEDLTVEAPGTVVKGTVEVDGSCDIQSATFTQFQLSDGDKATLKADRAPDGTLRVTVRGDVYDGRNFVKSAMAGPASKQKQEAKDVDLDIKFGTVVGHHGETLRALDLRLSRRAGAITSFALNAKLGRDTPLTGDLRARGNNGRPVILVENNDAGAFFRFTDTYSKLVGGEMWVALDPHSADKAPQEGILNIRDFSVRGEAALDRVAGAPQQPGQSSPGVEFSRMRVEFTRSPGRFTVREGIVRGPAVGATVDGQIDYLKNEVRMRGTFVPLYGLNNMFGQIPIVGVILGGGSNEGLLGVTYEVVGPPGSPVLRVNPISAVAPGLLRKFFEFPTAAGATQTYVPPQSYADPR